MMGQDDPQKRIADLEHLFAEQKRGASERTWVETKRRRVNGR
jgi:hypothetical protein